MGQLQLAFEVAFQTSNAQVALEAYTLLIFETLKLAFLLRKEEHSESLNTGHKKKVDSVIEFICRQQYIQFFNEADSKRNKEDNFIPSIIKQAMYMLDDKTSA